MCCLNACFCLNGRPHVSTWQANGQFSRDTCCMPCAVRWDLRLNLAPHASTSHLNLLASPWLNKCFVKSCCCLYCCWHCGRSHLNTGPAYGTWVCDMWYLMVRFSLKLRPQWAHVYINSVKPSQPSRALKQENTLVFLSTWVKACIFSPTLRLKLLLQTVQVNGRSTEWTTMCFWSCPESRKRLPQPSAGQRKVSCPPSMWATVTWSLNEPLRLKRWPQVSHANSGAAACVNMWR